MSTNARIRNASAAAAQDETLRIYVLESAKEDFEYDTAIGFTIAAHSEFEARSLANAADAWRGGSKQKWLAKASCRCVGIADPRSVEMGVLLTSEAFG